MNTQTQSSELLTEIHKISSKIQEEYPELEKHISEQPIGMPNDKDPDASGQLQDYLEGLQKLVRDYEKEH